jgi:hypothetical protein
MAEPRRYTEAEIERARKELTRRYRVDATEYEAIWYLRDVHEPGWRERLADYPADVLVRDLVFGPGQPLGGREAAKERP